MSLELSRAFNDIALIVFKYGAISDNLYESGVKFTGLKCANILNPSPVFREMFDNLKLTM